MMLYGVLSRSVWDDVGELWWVALGGTRAMSYCDNNNQVLENIATKSLQLRIALTKCVLAIICCLNVVHQ